MLFIRVRKDCQKVFTRREMNRVVKPGVRSYSSTKPPRTPINFAK